MLKLKLVLYDILNCIQEYLSIKFKIYSKLMKVSKKNLQIFKNFIKVNE